MYKKKADPKKRKMALTTEGTASMYFPDKTSEMEAAWSVYVRARLESLIPKLAHPHATSTDKRMMISLSMLVTKGSPGGDNMPATSTKNPAWPMACVVGFTTRRTSDVHSATAQRMAGIHFDKVQLSGIHRKESGSSTWDVVARWDKLALVALPFPFPQ